MIIKVVTCWGGKNIYQTITLPNGGRERIEQETWNRKAAREALDLLENVYHLKRRNIRFQVC